MLRSLAITLVAIGAAGCNTTALDVDISRFARLEEFEDLSYGSITPSQSYQYWELRHTFGRGSENDRTLASGGTRLRSELNAATLAALESAVPASGFFNGCLPAHCYTFILAVDAGGTVRVINSQAALVEFLAPITSLAEAALIVHSHNTFWSVGAESTGVREVGDGWEFLVLQLVRDCTPVQTDRVHILVRRDGSTRELGRALHTRLENACV